MKEDLHKVVLFLIDQTNKVAKRYSQQEFDRLGLGITVDQWVLLKLIEENSGMSQKELAARSVKDAASITRTLDLLQKKGFVERIAIPDNRRQYEIKVTDKGATFISENMQIVTKQRAKSLNGFTEEEVAQLQSMLLRIQKNME